MFTQRSSNSSIDPSKLGLECQVTSNQLLKNYQKFKDGTFIENMEPSPYWQQLLLQPSTYAFGIYALLGFLVISISGLLISFYKVACWFLTGIPTKKGAILSSSFSFIIF